MVVAGYRTLVLQDACASGSPARLTAALEIMAPLAELIDCDAFLAAI